MANSPERMGTAPVGKLLLSMAWPTILSMTISSLYNIVDSIFLARLSQDALTAVSFVMPMQLLMVSISVGTGAGVNSLISRSLGARKQELADDTAKTAVKLAIMNYLIYLTISLLITETFIGHYTKDPKVYEYATTYMHYVMGLSLFTAMEMMLTKILQSIGNMKASMVCVVTGALTNVVLDPILIFGLFGLPKLGVRGAAIATVIGQFFGFLFCIYFLKAQKAVNVNLRGHRINKNTIKEIYAVGLPAIVMQAIGSIMLIGYNSIIALDKTAVAVLGAYQKLQSFVFMPVIGINQGAMPIIGYNYGAGNKNRMMKAYRYALLSGLVVMTTGFLIFQLFPQVLLSLFSAKGKMLAVGVPALRIISISFIPAAFGIVTSSVFQATGHAVYSLLGSLLRQLIGILPLAFILFRIGGTGLSWYSFPLAEILGFSFLLFSIIRLYNKKLKFLGEDNEARN